MSAFALPQATSQRLAIWSLSLLSAVALGLATTVSVKAGFAIAILIAFVAAMVLRPSSILVILTVSVYLEVITLSGVTLSRLIAPIALLVVLFQIVRGEAFVRTGPQVLWIFLYSTLALASGLWTVSTFYTLTGLASLLIALTYMLCFAALLDSEQQLRRLMYVLAFSSLIVGLMSLASFKGLTFVPVGPGRGPASGTRPRRTRRPQHIRGPRDHRISADSRLGGGGERPLASLGSWVRGSGHDRISAFHAIARRLDRPCSGRGRLTVPAGRGAVRFAAPKGSRHARARGRGLGHVFASVIPGRGDRPSEHDLHRRRRKWIRSGIGPRGALEGGPPLDRRSSPRRCRFRRVPGRLERASVQHTGCRHREAGGGDAPQRVRCAQYLSWNHG